MDTAQDGWEMHMAKKVEDLRKPGLSIVVKVIDKFSGIIALRSADTLEEAKKTAEVMLEGWMNPEDRFYWNGRRCWIQCMDGGFVDFYAVVVVAPEVEVGFVPDKDTVKAVMAFLKETAEETLKNDQWTTNETRIMVRARARYLLETADMVAEKFEVK